MGSVLDTRCLLESVHLFDQYGSIIVYQHYSGLSLIFQIGWKMKKVARENWFLVWLVF